MSQALQSFRIQRTITIISVVLFLAKIIAWWLTNSVAILTDALESIVNVVAGFIGLYSLYVSAKPKDADHPYGHGKVEFISAAIEGTLIATAGLYILYKSINHFWQPHEVSRIDFGIIIVSVTAVINYFTGVYCEQQGRQNNSLALIASGRHLKTDAYTTLGIVAGLILLYFTKLTWIDSAVAIFFALLILFAGYRIIRSSVAGIMDEADNQILRKLVNMLNQNRGANWIDLHNLRIIKYGPTLHLDCHLTVPWYFNVHEAHAEIDSFSSKVREHFGESVELFVHSDGCLDHSCVICDRTECPVRKGEFMKKIEWTIENISSNQKHNVNS